MANVWQKIANGWFPLFLLSFKSVNMDIFAFSAIIAHRREYPGTCPLVHYLPGPNKKGLLRTLVNTIFYYCYLLHVHVQSYIQ